ncbi:alpha/beta hydrolase [Sphingomonas astaxanthinifaciens]|uniref:Serine aminopeptidase S33 domain-containing protein n=1 Tax=Sphingomonas astaxanthinifaciens DSM 22298 TaxID=1123267 RepID=A0ABQ5ZAS0_9SPHN|nr:alpha/beta hydrolase [Sphingomonas astaxanthinifaciens]GLR48586.1 hypothetical protein GCM10007925_23040 [Sphingomonas astaxanthinifaciens DSM 22298]
MPTLLTRLAALGLVVAPAAACADPVTDRIYPAPQAPITLAGAPAGTRLASVRTGDGIALTGLLDPGLADRPLLLVFHGNASSAATALAWLAPLTEDGFGILTAEYRGYSGNAGRPSEAGLVADAEAFLALARAEAKGRPVWVIGHSLGGGVALALSRRERLDALVTIGTFTRLRDMSGKLTRAFVPDDYRNTDAVRLLDEPYFVIHGLRDANVPWQQGEQLHKAAVGKTGASFILPTADHHPPAAALRPVFASISARLAGAPPPPLGSETKVVDFPTLAEAAAARAK